MDSSTLRYGAFGNKADGADGLCSDDVGLGLAPAEEKRGDE